jgi:hypothetical protein
MPGLVPGIHAFLFREGVDGRDKPAMTLRGQAMSRDTPE